MSFDVFQSGVPRTGDHLIAVRDAAHDLSSDGRSWSNADCNSVVNAAMAQRTATPAATATAPLNQHARAQVRATWKNIIDAVAVCYGTFNNLTDTYTTYIKSGTSGDLLAELVNATSSACNASVFALQQPPNYPTTDNPEYTRLHDRQQAALDGAQQAGVTADSIRGRLFDGPSYDPYVRRAAGRARADFNQELSIGRAIGATWQL